MTTASEWLALAQRCEKAMGPDREIDRLLDEAGGAAVGHEDHSEDDPENPRQPLRFTASIDAINAFIQQEFPHYEVSSARKLRISTGKAVPYAHAWLWDLFSEDRFTSQECVTEAHARSAALCRAMAAKAASP